MKHYLLAAGLAAGLVAAAMAPAAQAQTTIRFASPAPGPAPINAMLQEWSNTVTAASNGALTIEFTPGGVLGREGQLFDRVQNGVVDMAWDLQSAYPGRFPRSGVAELPGSYAHAGPASTALWSMLGQGLLGDEYAGVRPLAVFAFSTSTLMADEPVATLDDLRGLRLTTATLMRQRMLEMLGVQPVGLPIYEWYQGISRGTIDGVVETPSVVPAFRLHEVATHFAELPLGGGTGFAFMNEAAYDALPPEARAVLDAHTGAVLSRQLGDFWQGAAEFGTRMAREAGVTFAEMPAADLARMNELVASLTGTWIAETPEGQATYDAFVAAAAE